MVRTLPPALVLLLVSCGLAAGEDRTGPVAPKSTVRLFNGEDLKGLTTWLKDTKREDPRKVFSVKEASFTSRATASATSPPTKSIAIIV